MYRSFGLSQRSVDKPEPLAKAMLAADVAEAFADFEPRASIKAVEFEGDGAGRVRARVRVEVGEDG